MNSEEFNFILSSDSCLLTLDFPLPTPAPDQASTSIFRIA
jgi:hypothetical protein